MEALDPAQRKPVRRAMVGAADGGRAAASAAATDWTSGRGPVADPQVTAASPAATRQRDGPFRFERTPDVGAGHTVGSADLDAGPGRRPNRKAVRGDRSQGLAER